MATDVQLPAPPRDRASPLRQGLGVVLLIESFVAGLGTLTLLVMARVLDHTLTPLLGSSVVDVVWILAVLGASACVCVFVAGLCLIVGLGERRPVARATVLVAALGHLLLGLGQASDIVRGIATTPRQIVDLVLFSVALFLLSWALTREWWRMRTTPGHGIAPARSDR